MWSLAHVYIIEHLRFILQIISIAPVFMDLVYSLPGWMLRTSEQPGLCRIICLKVKYRDVTAFRKERKKVDWSGKKNISHLCISRTCKKSLNRESAFTRESVLSISSSSRRLPMIHTPWAGPRGESELSFPTTDPSTVPSSRFPVATYIPFVIETTMRLTTTFAPAERTAEINRFFFFLRTITPRNIQYDHHANVAIVSSSRLHHY